MSDGSPCFPVQTPPRSNEIENATTSLRNANMRLTSVIVKPIHDFRTPLLAHRKLAGRHVVAFRALEMQILALLESTSMPP